MKIKDLKGLKYCQIHNQKMMKHYTCNPKKIAWTNNQLETSW
jgi:ribosomal protein L24E